MTRKLLYTGLVCLLILAIVSLSTYFIGNYFVNFALVPNQGAEKREINETTALLLDEHDRLTIDEQREAAVENRDQWLTSVKDLTETVNIVSHDNYTLKGHLYKQQGQSHHWVVIVHGYQSSEAESQIIAPIFYDRGFNVLTMSLRAHAPSEGDYITMGLLESLDLMAWTNYIVDLDPESQIVYHGTSMGAATVMNASNHSELPKNVKVIIEDCGYSSTWEIFASELKQRFNLPSFPILNMAELVSVYHADFWLSENNPIESVQQTSIPMLFIHGDVDDFVPVSMAHELYNAHPTEDKDLLIVEGAGHDDSKYLETNLYFDTIFEFIDRYLH